jgi:hypothetical protein
MKIYKILLMLSLAWFSNQANAQNKQNEKKNEKCGKFFKIEQGNVDIKENNKSIDLGFTYTLMEKSDATSSIEVWVTLKNCKGTEKQVLSVLKFDSKTNVWSNNLNIANDKDCPWQPIYFNLSLKNNCGDTFSTDTMQFSELKKREIIRHSNHRTKKRFNPNLQTKSTNNDNPKDSCDFNIFTIKNGSITINKEKSALGIFISLALSEKKGLASNVVLVFEMENCKGEIQFIKVEMVYDEKTSTWIGKQGLIQNSDCSWDIVNYKILAFNTCNDDYESDEFDVKSLGANGTLPARNKIIARRRRSN